MKNFIGWAGFLLLNIALAAVLVYLIESHADAVWSFYWGVLALFCCYAIFLAGWLMYKTIKLRLGRPVSRVEH